MKRSFLLLLFLLLHVYNFAQKANNSVTKEELLKLERVNDLLKDIPLECHVTSYTFKFIAIPKKEGEKEKVTKIKCVGSEIRLDMQDCFKNGKAGDKLVFDLMETACLDKHKKKYTFVIK